jgi:aminoglycoside phosphotransferase family enzyme/predicted kinase
MPMDEETATGPQADVIAFLSDPASHASRPASVDIVETHGAIVFLAGDEALKIKRAIALAYLDFSTLEKREAVCRHEFAINQPNAPEIYRSVVAITRAPGGQLAIGGDGTPVEWAVRMARFGQEHVLSHVAGTAGIDDRLAADLAAMLLAAHGVAGIHTVSGGAERLGRIIGSVGTGLATSSSSVEGASAHCQRFRALADTAFARSAAVLDRRARAGLVRRCHGDLHLGNIVIWNGRPTLFDALEFDEDLATIDLLYDLAFLVMDLDRRGQRRAAQIVLDRYLSGSGRDIDLEGLSALPLFLGLRAAIRALVGFDRSHSQSGEHRSATEAHALATLGLALGYLGPTPPRLVAVAGLSGTGKTTLAAGLAPGLAPAPGAVHLRSDVVRKQLVGVAPLERLPPAAYTPEAAQRVYAELIRRGRLALEAGHSVIVDAVFRRPEERAMPETLAAELNVPFDGIWLEAAPDTLKTRVRRRTGDASDATPEVVERQLASETGPISWHRLPATGDADAVLQSARQALALRPANH